MRESGQPQTVLVRCAQCEALVARYVLADYYHHGKGLESYLRTRGGQVAESGRRITEELARVEQLALEGYARALDWLRRAGKEP